LVGGVAGVEMDDAAAILEIEKAALDRWCKGDPHGFLEISALDVVYFDPFLDSRLDGIGALTEYYESFRGRVSIPKYELHDPHVQLLGSGAVLTFGFTSYSGNGSPCRWNCTEVYRSSGGEWQIIQTHWSFANGSRQ
jgi:hypothetical protein